MKSLRAYAALLPIACTASASDLDMGFATYPVDQVPDSGATAALLGLALFGLAVMSRRRKRQ